MSAQIIKLKRVASIHTKLIPGSSEVCIVHACKRQLCFFVSTGTCHFSLFLDKSRLAKRRLSPTKGQLPRLNGNFPRPCCQPQLTRHLQGRTFFDQQTEVRAASANGGKQIHLEYIQTISSVDFGLEAFPPRGAPLFSFLGGGFP